MNYRIAIFTLLLFVGAADADALRTIKDSIGEALDDAREATRTCRDEAVDVIRDAKDTARDLRVGNKRDIDDLDAALRKAIRRTKVACPKKVTSSLEDALDALDDLPVKKPDAAPAPAPKPAPYEPTMDDVSKARDACNRSIRYRNEEKPCLDATLQVMRGPHRALALQIPQSCASALRDEVSYCVQMAAKAKKSPIEINAYCVKSTRFTKEVKDCITEWSNNGGASAPGALKALLESCTSHKECAGGMCLTASGRSYCTQQCRVARDCVAAGGGRVTEWTCEPTKENTTGKPYCMRSSQ